MAPPPPVLLNGNLSNVNGKPNNVVSPPINVGLLKEIETGKDDELYVSCSLFIKQFFLLLLL
jgi:hypothetical protein